MYTPHAVEINGSITQIGNIVTSTKLFNRYSGLNVGWLYTIQYNQSAKGTVENLNTLRPRQNGRHFPDDIFKCIFLNENVWISINISMKFVPRGPNNNFIALVQIMAWRRPGDKPLSELMMVSLLTHICVTRPQWVNRRSQYRISKRFGNHEIC